MSKPTPVAWTDQDEIDDLHKEPAVLMWGKETADDLSRKQNKMIPLYLASALQALEEENARLREEFLSAKEAHLSITRETNARATAAEARLKEALKVIEPFAKSDMQDPDWREDNSCVTGTCDFTVGHLRAARRFITALQEKENTNGN